MAKTIKISSLRDLYEYMQQRKSYFSNLICKKILEAIDNDLSHTVVVIIETEDDENFMYELKVYQRDYIGALSKNFNGLIDYEDYELAAKAKKIIDENAN